MLWSAPVGGEARSLHMLAGRRVRLRTRPPDADAPCTLFLFLQGHLLPPFPTLLEEGAAESAEAEPQGRYSNATSAARGACTAKEVRLEAEQQQQQQQAAEGAQKRGTCSWGDAPPGAAQQRQRTQQAARRFSAAAQWPERWHAHVDQEAARKCRLLCRQDGGAAAALGAATAALSASLPLLPLPRGAPALLRSRRCTACEHVTRAVWQAEWTKSQLASAEKQARLAAAEAKVQLGRQPAVSASGQHVNRQFLCVVEVRAVGWLVEQAGVGGRFSWCRRGATGTWGPAPLPTCPHLPTLPACLRSPQLPARCSPTLAVPPSLRRTPVACAQDTSKGSLGCTVFKELPAKRISMRLLNALPYNYLLIQLTDAPPGAAAAAAAQQKQQRRQAAAAQAAAQQEGACSAEGGGEGARQGMLDCVAGQVTGLCLSRTWSRISQLYRHARACGHASRRRCCQGALAVQQQPGSCSRTLCGVPPLQAPPLTS